MRPLDLIVRDQILHNERIGFLKIDVEGNELNVLKGATQVLMKHRPVVEIEVNKGTLAMAGVQPKSVMRLFRECGYEAYVFDRLDLTPVGEDLSGRSDVVNVVFMPQRS